MEENAPQCHEVRFDSLQATALIGDLGAERFGGFRQLSDSLAKLLLVLRHPAAS
jgi:hypothetical protein